MKKIKCHISEQEKVLPLISRERAEFAVGETDCSERKFTPIEKEDNIRFVLLGAEIQRDKDYFDSGRINKGRNK